MKELICDGLLIGWTLFILGQLVYFLVVGNLTIGEPNRPLLIVEIIAIAGMVGLAIERLVNDLRKLRQNGANRE